MTPQTLPANTLATALLPLDNALLRNLILAVAGSLLLWISAKISIPFWPVPLTMQTLVVLMIGMAFGARLGGGDGGAVSARRRSRTSHLFRDTRERHWLGLYDEHNRRLPVRLCCCRRRGRVSRRTRLGPELVHDGSGHVDRHRFDLHPRRAVAGHGF